MLYMVSLPSILQDRGLRTPVTHCVERMDAFQQACQATTLNSITSLILGNRGYCSLFMLLDTNEVLHIQATWLLR